MSSDLYDVYRVLKDDKQLARFPESRILTLSIFGSTLILGTLLINFFLITLAGLESRARDFSELGDRPYYWRVK